jgi:hypothetical protein
MPDSLRSSLLELQTLLRSRSCGLSDLQLLRSYFTITRLVRPMSMLSKFVLQRSESLDQLGFASGEQQFGSDPRGDPISALVPVCRQSSRNLVKRDGHAVVAAAVYNLSLFPTATSATKRLFRHLLQVIEYQLTLGSYYAATFRWALAPCRFHETSGRPNDLRLRLAHRRYSDRIYGGSSPPRYAIGAIYQA